MIFELFKPKLLNINYFQRLCFEILFSDTYVSTGQLMEKHLWKRDIFSNTACQWPATLVKMSLFHKC